MASEALETARSRYRAAYDAYRACALRVAQKLENGANPTPEEVAEETRALETLTAARRRLLDVIGNSR